VNFMPLRRAAVLGATLAAVTAMTAFSPLTAWAQAFPQKPVKIINPFPPGSPIDAVGRLLAQQLNTMWDQPVIVESKAGAGGTIGAGFVAAAPDGHTLLVSSQSPVTVAPVLNKALPYDSARDLLPVWGIASSGLVIVVTPSLPVNNLKELVAYAKAKPKDLSFASSGNGTIQHLAGELFVARAGAPLLHVPYRGGAPAATDLMGGQVHVMFDSLSNQLANIRAGRVRALAVMRATRASALPDVPTTAQAGVAGLEMRGWIGVFAPKRTAPDALARLRADSLKGMTGPEVHKQLLGLGLDGEILEAETFGKYVQADLEQVKEIVRTANITLE